MSRKIGIASAIWGMSILLSRIIGLIREAVIGRILGAGKEADVFWTAFVLPDFLNYLLAGGALAIVFIPIFGGYLARNEEEKGWEAFSIIANAIIVLLGSFLILLWFAVPWLVNLIAPGFDKMQSKQLIALTRIILPAQLFHVIGGLLSAALQARDRHVLPAIAPLIYTGCIITGGLMGGVYAGAYGFAWGVLAGSFLGPFLMPLIGCIKTGIRWHGTFALKHPDVKTYFFRSLPIMLGWSIVVVDDWFLRRQGSLLESGVISALQYAKTLMKVPMGVFGLATGVAAYPTLTRLITQGDYRNAYSTLTSALKQVLFLAFAAQAVLTCAGPEIARIIYGSRIGVDQHVAIGVSLGLFSIGLWAWAGQSIVARGFYAMGKTWIPPILGTTVAVAAYPFYSLSRMYLGTYGLVFASTLAISLYMSVLMYLLSRYFEGVSADYLSFFIRTVPATISGILPAIMLRPFLTEVNYLLRAGILMVISLLLFLVASKLMKIREFSVLTNLLKKQSKT
ncbi:murein biosynthesis integral membrane protein MurJ [bacterium]|nr:murein biosynthesis integral membrane protein MurJ [candidate division CSSED10-310 bacterium]